MARPITVKFFRSEIIRKKLEALPDDLREPVRRAVANAGDIVVERAKALAPVDKGVLRDSIRWTTIEDGKRQNLQAIRIGPSGAYLVRHKRIPDLPRWIEFGTAPSQKGKRGVRFAKGGKLKQTQAAATRTSSGTPAHPFLFPAWRQTKKKAKDMIKVAVNKALAEAAKRGG
jgi:HK97 gp10 family phage protein